MMPFSLTQSSSPRTRQRRSVRLGVVVVGVALAATACAGSSAGPAAGSGSSAAATASSSSPSPTAAFNSTDVAFVAGMTPHHKGGIELGTLAADKGVNPTVKQLGAGIMAKQTEELTTLQGLLSTYGSQPDMVEPIDVRDKRDMAALATLKGAAFDRKWLEVISGHHSAAIQMAMIEKSGGQDPAARALSEAIIVQQTKELTQFNALIAKMSSS